MQRIVTSFGAFVPGSRAKLQGVAWPLVLRHAAVLGLSLCLGSLIWSLFPHKAKTDSATTSQTSAAPVRPNAAAFAARIASAHLFGQDGAAAAGPSAAAVTVTIEGILYSADPAAARVILNVGGKSGVFKTGDTLSDGETIATIGTTAVQLGSGISKRVVALASVWDSGPSNGIQIAGLANPSGQDQPFPGTLSFATQIASAYAPRLQPPSIPMDADPVAQMQALRQQLVRPVNSRRDH